MTTSSLQPKSSVLITGGNGSLGSAVAIQLATFQPRKHHLLLTVRKLTDPRTIKISTSLEILGASYEFLALDLSSLKDVRSFSAKLKGRLEKKEIAPFKGGGVVLSAATITYVKDSRTTDGWNEMYGINVLAPMLLLRDLLPLLEGALVVNVASAAHHIGRFDYFSGDGKNKLVYDERNGGQPQEKLAMGECFKRYGSTKLLSTMALYALQRRLNINVTNTTQIASLDPGGMSGESNLGGQNWILRWVTFLLWVFGPVVRSFKKDALNPPEVPAKAIAELLERNSAGRNHPGGKYFVLDDERKSSPASLDEKVQEVAWVKISEDLELSPEI